MTQAVAGDRLTSRSFWKLIGQLLKQHRTVRDWYLIDVQHHGGPNYATVELHEAGNIRTTTKLERHCRVFDLDIVDAFRLVLDHGTVEDVSAEIAPLIGKYVRTTQDGRAALRMMAAALPYAESSAGELEAFATLPPVRQPATGIEATRKARRRSA